MNNWFHLFSRHIAWRCSGVCHLDHKAETMYEAKANLKGKRCIQLHKKEGVKNSRNYIPNTMDNRTNFRPK